VSAAAYRYRPVLDRRPCDQTIRERAEFLAHEIHHDRLAPEAEIADAIELEIKRFARPEELAAAPVDNGFRGSFRRVDKVRRGPLKTHRNGTTAYEWAALVLSCGHEIQHPRSRNPRATPPAFAKCGQCRA
jgi:hypothetical protein